MVRQLTQQEYLKWIMWRHKDKYLYDKIVYSGSKNKVIVGCKIHSDFKIRANQFKLGSGCPRCGRLIGKTYNTLKRRFEGQQQMPIGYVYEIINVIESEDGRYISELENKLKQLNKKHRYIPQLNFGGMTECFSQYKLI